jgi:hypothetical protein
MEESTVNVMPLSAAFLCHGILLLFPQSSIVMSEPSFIKQTVDTVTLKPSKILPKAAP